MQFYDPLTSNAPAKPEMALTRMAAGADDLEGVHGDSFPPEDLLKAAAATPEKRRLRERKRLKNDPRRPTNLPEESAKDAAAESWDFGADPMLWARARYGERTPKEKLFSDATPYRTSGLLGRLFGR